MLNNTKKLIVYLDSDTLEYMYLSYTEKRNYPVMRRLFGLLHKNFVGDVLVVPLSMEHLYPYIKENTIDRQFLNMMGDLGQVQFLQRFTVKMLQLIRAVTNFFEQPYKKEIWKDVFSSDPDEKYVPGFSKYFAITAQNALNALEREKKLSQVCGFIEKYKMEVPAEETAVDYFRYLWNQFRDVMRPYLPVNGSPDDNMERFLSCEDIKDIPEFHIISSILYPLFDSYGIRDVEAGLKDDVLFAAETAAAYMPYCHFYVTVTDIAELFLMTGINELYSVKVYDNNESSLYRMIDDISKAVENKKEMEKRETGKTMFRRGGRSLY